LEAEKDAEKQRASQMFAEAKAKAKADSVEKQQKKIRMQQLQDDRAILIAEYHGVLRDGVILSATNLPFLKNEVY
jgi:high-affinity K+ transport system ATPase subunit B